MTAARHRSAAAAPQQADGVIGSAHMWAVAWRLHRVQIAVLLAVIAASAAAMIVFRMRLLALYEQFDCPRFGPGGQGYVDCRDQTGLDIWWSHGFMSWSQLAHYGMVAGPVILGAFAAAPIFTREFSRGTQVLALTQSVGVRSWFIAKTVVMVVPLTAGLLVLGYLMEWMDGAVGQTAFRTLDKSNFFAHGPIPAATGLMAFGLALAVGMISRTMMTALVTAIVAGGVLLIGVVQAQPHVLPPLRTATPVAELYAPTPQADYDAMNAPPEDEAGEQVMKVWFGDDPNEIYLRSGYLDLDGDPVGQKVTTDLYRCFNDAWQELVKQAGVPTDESGYPILDGPDDPTGTLEFLNASNAANLTCATEHGISANYQDVLPGSMLTPLRWAVGGILVAVAALFIGVGAARLRWAVAKR